VVKEPIARRWRYGIQQGKGAGPAEVAVALAGDRQMRDRAGGLHRIRHRWRGLGNDAQLAPGVLVDGGDEPRQVGSQPGSASTSHHTRMVDARPPRMDAVLASAAYLILAGKLFSPDPNAQARVSPAADSAFSGTGTARAARFGFDAYEMESPGPERSHGHTPAGRSSPSPAVLLPGRIRVPLLGLRDPASMVLHRLVLGPDLVAVVVVE
jgi:hypothetical protein